MLTGDTQPPRGTDPKGSGAGPQEGSGGLHSAPQGGQLVREPAAPLGAGRRSWRGRAGRRRTYYGPWGPLVQPGAVIPWVTTFPTGVLQPQDPQRWSLR